MLWIGYLQWHFRTHGKTLPVPEPVLSDYKNIECRDAILAFDRREPVTNEQGVPETRWDGETTRVSAVTGDLVPDESARVPIYRYVNPRKALWPASDFIVGNPPFVANRNMRAFHGDGYVEALKEAYKEVQEAVDFVMYFWLRGAQAVVAGTTRRCGLITTNSIRMLQNQGIVERSVADGCSLYFAIPDHPWPDGSSDAEVRISMTVVGIKNDGQPRLALTPSHDEVARGRHRLSEVNDRDLRLFFPDTISPDLSPEQDISSMKSLQSNAHISSAGMKPYAQSLIVSDAKAAAILPNIDERTRYAPPYRNGQDIGQRPRGVRAIDLFGLAEDDVQVRLPVLYQYLLTTSKEERKGERNARLRDEWWLFEANRPDLRSALEGLSKYIVTVESSPVRIFTFLDGGIMPDQKLRVIASDDPFILGVLCSRVHAVFAKRAGGRQGVRNTPVYNSRCFTHFPFPLPNDRQRSSIGSLAERMDAFRKQRIQEEPKLTLTAMYNVLGKLRNREPLTAKEEAIHSQGLVSVLKKLHDDIDTAVFDAYGWPTDLADTEILDRLIALNARRIAEEKAGQVHLLRPAFQNRDAAVRNDNQEDADESRGHDTSLVGAGSVWPTKLAVQIAAIRDLVRKPGSSWSVVQVCGAFRGAKKKDVEAVLESLTALGLILTFETPDGRRWKVAGFPTVLPPASAFG